jgi:hypothetical protein
MCRIERIGQTFRDKDRTASSSSSRSSRREVTRGAAAYKAPPPVSISPRPRPLQPPHHINFEGPAPVGPGDASKTSKTEYRQLSLHDVMWHSTASSMEAQSDDLPPPRRPRRRFHMHAAPTRPYPTVRTALPSNMCTASSCPYSKFCLCLCVELYDECINLPYAPLKWGSACTHAGVQLLLQWPLEWKGMPPES